MSDTLIDSYNNTSPSNTISTSATRTQIGQAFAASSSASVTSCKFIINSSGSISGLSRCKLYAASGTIGTNAIPTGSALGTSNETDVAVGTTPVQVEFIFGTPVSIVSGQPYAIVFEDLDSDGAQFLTLGSESTSPTHAGNRVRLESGVYSGDSDRDVPFWVYGILSQPTINNADDLNSPGQLEAVAMINGYLLNLTS